MDEQLPVWLNPGVEPPESLKNTGWQPGVKPAAQHMNWLLNRTYNVLRALQEDSAKIIVSETNIPIAERNPNSFYFIVTDSAPAPVSPNITVSPTMGLRKVEG